MESLIVVLIGVIWVLYGLYSANTKKKTRGTAFEKRTQVTTLEEMVKVLQGVDVKEKECEEEAINLKKEERYLYNEFVNIEEFTDSEMGKEIEEKPLTAKENDTLNIEKKEIAFDLRQAVIYNEIINKKYI